MNDLGWREAILKVLADSGEAMHYTDIADKIVAQNLRKNVGATPASSVNATVTTSLKNDGDDSPFLRVSRGHYSIRKAATASPAQKEPEQDEDDETGLINAFGMFWRRGLVLWTTATPCLWGQQQAVSKEVDFSSERGVYLLHDGREVVYVGRANEQSLGTRLKQHTVDRLNGRWDRFSWFGVYPVTEDGRILTSITETFSMDNLITTMEALLIEGLEPPQNRKRGDEFRAVEYLQVVDPQIEKEQTIRVLDDVKKKVLSRQ
jgi:hypothetical protein